jgi:hypothetical protein
MSQNNDNNSNESVDDLKHLLHKEAIYLAQLAVNFDTNNELEAAVYYYRVWIEF